MNWIIYAGVFAVVFIIVFLTSEFFANKEKIAIDEPFSFENTRAMKGLAICMIVFNHMISRFGDGIIIFTPFGGIGNSIFLLISAYGLNTSYMRGV